MREEGHLEAECTLHHFLLALILVLMERAVLQPTCMPSGQELMGRGWREALTCCRIATAPLREGAMEKSTGERGQPSPFLTK